MPTKITKYRALDGKEFDSYQEAHDYEVHLKMVKEVRAAVKDIIETTVDQAGRRVYNIENSLADTFADMLVTTELFVNVRTILKR